MIRTEIPSGIYVDALPTGEFACCLFNGSVETHLGNLRAPGGELPFYVRVTNKPSFKFAGQSTIQGRTLTWENGAFTSLLITPCGVSPVIYNQYGSLVISDCSVGTQGYRYVDFYTGRIFTGDETIFSPTARLAEFTDLGDGIIIGQGIDVIGCQVWDGKFHRMIEADNCFTIRANRFMDLVAVSFYRQGKPSVIIQTSMNELRNLPIVEPIPPVEQKRNLYIYQTLVGTK